MTQPQLSNALKYEDLLQRATDLGKMAGEGRDTQMKFYLTVLEGAYQGAVDLDADKHGKGVDDATKLAEAYVKAHGTASMFDAKEMRQQKLISTVRTSVRLGMWPKGGPGEPVNVVGKLMQNWGKLRSNPQTRKNIQDAANVFLKFARKQLKLDSVIADSDLEQFCFKIAPEGQTAEDVLISTRRTLQKLYDGKINHNTVQDNDVLVKEAIEKITKRLTAIAKAKGAKSGPNAKV